MYLALLMIVTGLSVSAVAAYYSIAGLISNFCGQSYFHWCYGNSFGGCKTCRCQLGFIEIGIMRQNC